MLAPRCCKRGSSLEAKTQDAIDVCHTCGHPHDPQAGHIAPEPQGDAKSNVIEVDFGQA